MYGGYTKRRSPFGEDPARAPTKAKKPEALSPYERTLLVLRNAQRTVLRASDHRQYAPGVPCGVCRERSEDAPCSYCSKRACEMCLRQCEHCQDVFCSECSVVNYDMAHDRLFCIGCNASVAREERHPTTSAMDI
eukprot:tig00000350_g24325.t1